MQTLVFGILFLMSTVIFGQAFVNGEIKSTTRWSGQVFIDGDVVVSKGVTLTIDPGTHIVVRANMDRTASGKDAGKIEIVVNGILHAAGGEGVNGIIFTSDSATPLPGDWHGIILKNGVQTSQLTYCEIEYAYKAITCFGSSPLIRLSTIRFNNYSGISCEIRSRAQIRNCEIRSNAYAGIVCELGSAPLIEGCTISENEHGILIFDRSQPDLGRLPAGAEGSRGENHILGNRESALQNRSANQISAQNNTWDAAAPEEIGESIFDRRDNPVSGEVLFLPLYGQPVARNNRPRFAASTAGKQKTEEATPVREPASPATENIPDPRPSESDSLLATAPPKNSPAYTSWRVDNFRKSKPPEDSNYVIVPETLIVYREVYVEKPVPRKDPEPEPAPIIEPVPEKMLDGGRRQYEHLAVPEYPEIYRQTGHQGNVIVEVTVGRNGEVESYRVVRTNGDYFTTAAVEAIRRMKYRPGAVDGRPVRFKIFESFDFKLEN